MPRARGLRSERCRCCGRGGSRPPPLPRCAAGAPEPSLARLWRSRGEAASAWARRLRHMRLPASDSARRLRRAAGTWLLRRRRARAARRKTRGRGLLLALGLSLVALLALFGAALSYLSPQTE